MASLTERDRGLLNNEITDLQDSNVQLQDGIETDLREVNNLTLFDIPYKKNLDEKHYNIYAFEEEWRLMTGRTVIGAVQEDAFWITAPESNVVLQIRDGRFIAWKNAVEMINVPIIPYRGYVVGSACGPNFDIWTRDRYGSSTSAPGVPQSYRLHEGNNKFKAIINGSTYEINIFDNDTIQANNGVLIVDPYVLSSSIGQAFNNVQVNGAAVLENVQCLYNPVRQTFTLISNTVGPTSTVEVVTTASDEIAYLMKFNNQTMVPGRYANNKLKVSIDGVVQTIELIFDVRVPIYSPVLGYALDDFSADWRWDFSRGPMFPAQADNGRKIASMIQNKLREFTDGYKKSECFYYTDSDKFVVYSGTFGPTSSVDILPADDSLRDLAPFVGLNSITESRRNEVAYTTLVDLFSYLNSYTNLACTLLQNPSRSCYSLMSLVRDISLSNQKFKLQTTNEYDRASLEQSRLYSSKLTINDSNNKIDLDEGSGEITKLIPHGDYSEFDLASVIQDTLNGTGTAYTVTYKQSTKKFSIQRTSSVTMLFDTGSNKSQAITTYIGFANTSNQSGTLFTGNSVSFAGTDFFSMAEISQLVPKSYFNFLPPYYIDYSFGELNWLNVLLVLLGAENNPGSDVLFLLENQTSFNNEAYLNQWEAIAALELQAELDQYEALRQEIGFYSRISTSDTNYTRKVAALNNSIANINSLQSFSVHASIMNLRSSTANFVYGVDFEESYDGVGTFPDSPPKHYPLGITIPVVNDDRIYNQPAPEFRYADDKYIPAHAITPLYNSSATFNLFKRLAFSIQSNKTAMSGYAISGADFDGMFMINRPNDTAATMLSVNAELYDLSTADTITVSVDGTAPQSSVVAADSAYVTGTDVLSDSVFTITPDNDTIDYYDGVDHSVTLASGVYKGSAFRTEIETKLQAESPATNFTVSWAANQLTINATTNEITVLNENSQIVNRSGAGPYTIELRALRVDPLIEYVSACTRVRNVTKAETYTILSFGGAGTEDRIFTQAVTYPDLTDVLEVDYKFTVTTVQYKFASGPNASVSAGKMMGFLSDVSGLSITGVTRNIYVQTDINDDFSVTVNGVPSQQLTLSQGNYTDASMALALQASIDAAIGSVVIVSIVTSMIKISTIARGTGTSISKAAGVHDLLRSIYLLTAVPVAGSGDVADITNVTADEIAIKISSTFTGITGTSESGRVRVTTVSMLGELSVINFTLNAFASVVGFLSLSRGQEQNNKLGVAIDGVDAVINLATSTSQITGTAVAADMQTKLRAVGSGGFVDSKASYDSFDAPSQFKVVSGTSGVSSTVFVTQNTISIGTANNKIDFEETSSVQLTAIVANGLYNGSTLATAIQLALNGSAGHASIYTVSFNSITKQMTLTSNGAGGAGLFTLRFGTGTNIAQSIATTIGFYKVDETGALSYTSDRVVKLQQSFFELNFDSQTNQTGFDIDDSRLKLTDVDITSTVYWGASSVDDFNYKFSDYPTVKSLIDVLRIDQPHYATDVQSELWSRYPEKYVVHYNDQFSVRIGSGPIQTVTFAMTNGQSYSNSDPDETVNVGDTLSLFLNEPSDITVTNENSPIVSRLGSGPYAIELRATAVNPPNEYISLCTRVRNITKAETYTILSFGGSGYEDRIFTQATIYPDLTDVFEVDYTYIAPAIATITMPIATTNGNHTAYMIQLLVRALLADNVENQPAYTNFVCVYQNGRYYLISGTGGTTSSVHVISGNLKTKLKLGSNETIGTGDVVNNYFTTYSEVQSKLSMISGMTVVNDNSHIKLTSSDKIQIISTPLATRLGFFGDNLEIDPEVDLTDVACTSLQRTLNPTDVTHSVYVYVPIHIHSPIPFVVFLPANQLHTSATYAMKFGDVVQVSSSTSMLPSPLQPGVDYYVIEQPLYTPNIIRLAASAIDAFNNVPITLLTTGGGFLNIHPSLLPYAVNRGYENRGDITATYYITDDSLINTRRPAVVTRISNITVRQAQIPARETEIIAALTVPLYSDRWNEVKKRLNKKTGPYYKVGEKEKAIDRSRQQIAENNATIVEIQAMLA